MTRKTLTEQEIWDMLQESDVEMFSDDDDAAEKPMSSDNFIEETDEPENPDDDGTEAAETTNEIIINEDVSKNKRLKWKSKKFENKFMENSDEVWDYGQREFWTPIQYFTEYVNDDFWQLVAEQSNIRAMQSYVTLNSSADEYKILAGAHIISGCMKLPRVRLYYRPAIRVPGITQLPRDRFFKLRNHMHFVNSLEVTNNENWKIQRVIDMIRKKVQFTRKIKKIKY